MYVFVVGVCVCVCVDSHVHGFVHENSHFGLQRMFRQISIYTHTHVRTITRVRIHIHIHTYTHAFMRTHSLFLSVSRSLSRTRVLHYCSESCGGVMRVEFVCEKKTRDCARARTLSLSFHKHTQPPCAHSLPFFSQTHSTPTTRVVRVEYVYGKRERERGDCARVRTLSFFPQTHSTPVTQPQNSLRSSNTHTHTHTHAISVSFVCLCSRHFEVASSQPQVQGGEDP